MDKSKFWEENLPIGYYDKILESGMSKNKGIQSNIGALTQSIRQSDNGDGGVGGGGDGHNGGNSDDDESDFDPDAFSIAETRILWIDRVYRDAYGFFASNGILFNHESPLRGETFVTRKITRALSRIKLGLQTCLYLGNLDAKRDWGHAKDYVEMQWLMLQQDEPDDFCIATGVQYSVRDFVNFAWGHLGKTIRWEGEGMDEKGYDVETSNLIVAVDKRYFRPTEVETLLGDPSKAKEKLGWEPKITLEEMVHEMMENDINIAKRDSLVKKHGFKAPDFKE